MDVPTGCPNYSLLQRFGKGGLYVTDRVTSELSEQHRPEFRVHMVATMMGIAIALAMDHLFRSEGPFEVAHAMAFAGFAITAIIFTLAMMGIARDSAYWYFLRKHHVLAAYDLFSDMAMGIALIFMALHLSDIPGLLWSNLALRLLDIASELIVVMRYEAQLPAKEQASPLSWIRIDSIGLVGVGLAAYGYGHWSWQLSGVSLAFLASVIVGALLDLRDNGDFYFGEAPKTHTHSG